eukprot:903914-Lingulodinium_polyedra.AAC.1
MKDFLMQGKLRPVELCGCSVGLRGADQKLLKKPWTVYTTSDAMLKYLELPCTKDHIHGETRGADAAASAYYPKPMVKRICKAFDEETSDVMTNSTEHAYMDEETLPLDEEEILNQADSEEKAKAEKYVMKVHRACGHTPPLELARALRARGCSPLIYAVAKGLKCSSCIENHWPAPRNHANLDPVPEMWTVVESDLGEIVHPCKPVRWKFVLFIDVGSRLKVARLMHETPDGDNKMVNSRDLTK